MIHSEIELFPMDPCFNNGLGLILALGPEFSRDLLPIFKERVANRAKNQICYADNLKALKSLRLKDALKDKSFKFILKDIVPYGISI
jgi:hypothetical protein